LGDEFEQQQQSNMLVGTEGQQQQQQQQQAEATCRDHAAIDGLDRAQQRMK